MDRFQLAKELEKAGVDRRLYWIEGVETDCAYDDASRLVHQDGKWKVLYRERGHDRLQAEFDTEPEACEWFLGRMLRLMEPRPVHKLTPEERARSEQIAEERRAENRAFLAERGLLEE